MQKLPKSLIVSISGIRGIVGKDFTKESVTRLIFGYSKIIKKGRVLIARDTRSHSPKVTQWVSNALQALGFDVEDAGIQPTPTLNIAVPLKKAQGGIIVSASHNPEEYNGLKFFDHTGHYLNQIKVNRLIRNAEKSIIFSMKKTGGIKLIDNLNNLHIQKLEKISSSKIKSQKPRVLVDAINGAGCDFLSKFLKKLGCDFIIINDDPKKPFPHQPEPNFKNLKTVSKIIKKSRFDIGFATDPDCDRVIVLTPKKGVICEEYTLALSLLRLKKQEKRGKVVINYATSMLNDYIVKNSGLKILRTAVGEHNVYSKMQQKKAILGGEGNGGVMDPRINSTRDSFTGIVHILSLITESRKTIDEIVDQLPKYEIIKDKISIENIDLKRAYSQIEKYFLNRKPQPRKISREDGIWLGWEDRWVLFRPSNTEPIARIICESPTIDETKVLVATVRKIIR